MSPPIMDSGSSTSRQTQSQLQSQAQPGRVYLSSPATFNPHAPPRAIASRSSSLTALQGSYNSAEPPSTPQKKTSRIDKGKGPAVASVVSAQASPVHTRIPSYTSHHTPLEHYVPQAVEKSSSRRERREGEHGRGKSWSSVTRDSVVDNLLSSFDRMPGVDTLPAQTPETAAMACGMPLRSRGHTYSSSISADLITSDDTSSQYTRKSASRGKRSNSSSSFMDSPASVARIRDAKPRSLARSSSEIQSSAGLALHSRSSTIKGRKSSTASSFDYGCGAQVVSANNHGPTSVSRSPNRENNTFTQSAPETLSDSILSRGRPVPSLYSAYELPFQVSNGIGGSRKPHDVLMSSHSQPSVPTLHELDSNQQPDASQEAAMAQNNIPQSIRDQASEFVRASQMRTGSMSSNVDHTTSGPVGVSSTHISANEGLTQRPGFFRRVFGSSTRGTPTADMSKQASRESSLSREATQSSRKKSASSSTHLTSTTRSESNLSKTNNAAPAIAAVNKKPSFFRRRKKSVSDDLAQPGLPQHPTLLSAEPEDEFTKQQIPLSPGASSLRQVLDQFMDDDDAPTENEQMPLSRFLTDSVDGDSTDNEMFHSGYTPPPDASIRREAPLEHRGSIVARPLVSDSSEHSAALNSRNSPEPNKLSVLTAQSEGARPQFRHTDSYLSDASDDDRSKAPSIVSAVDDTYRFSKHLPLSPVSPFASPRIGAPPNGTIFTAASPLQSEFTISPGATIRAVASAYGDTTSTDWDYGVTESKGLGIDVQPQQTTDRLWIAPNSPDDMASSDISLPLEGPKALPAPAQRMLSQDAEPKGSLPVVEVNGTEVRPSVDIARHLNAVTQAEPTTEDMEYARKIYTGDEVSLGRLQAAAWLGERTPISARTLVAFMSYFDWSGKNILTAMRGLCEKLVLKGESQQVDRVLEAFAIRWNGCNPNNGFKGPGVVHNICYAVLLLNTDQHIANIQHKMTRSEFIKNTMPAIKDAAEKNVKPFKQPGRPSIPWQDSSSSVPDSPTIPQASQEEPPERTSNDFKRSMKRLSIRPSVNRHETDPGPGGGVNNYASNSLVTYPWEGSEREWLLEVGDVLKTFYTSIVADPLPLHGAPEKGTPLLSSSTNNLSVSASVLRRTGSIISKAPSEGFNYRGRKMSDNQSLANRWQSKSRPRQKIYPASTVGSSRTSFDDNNSMLSPAGSSMWSRISTGRTQPTMSVESFALTHDFKQSLGFTNALSQAIIREEAPSDTESFHRVGSLLDDESLELAGAPWAKEGMVKHKHHLEGPDKKAKERSWHECFAVVEKGYLHLFSFNRNPTTRISSGNARARRHTGATKPASLAPSVVGGGNWTDNAEELGQFLLRQTIATSLPSPGYSKTRPHVWALSLPTGAVHLFQVGTAEIAEEFATTANYWSARLSKEPLVGGIDNIEYGWSDNILNPALLSNTTSFSPPPSRQEGSALATSNSIGTMPAGSRQSMQSSIRTSFDQGGHGSKSRLPGDRATISDWRPPASSMLPSQLMEIDQLRSLSAYILSVEAELAKHNELRNAIPLAYTHNNTRLTKVMNNWEKKSSYLLKEVVKFRTYIEALERAGVRRGVVYEERKIREEDNAAMSAVARARRMSTASEPAGKSGAVAADKDAPPVPVIQPSPTV